MEICEYCSRGFKSARGLTQHLNSSKCNALHRKSLLSSTEEEVLPHNEALKAVYCLDAKDVSQALHGKRVLEQDDSQAGLRKVQRVGDGDLGIQPRKGFTEVTNKQHLVMVPRQHVGIMDEEVLLLAENEEDNLFPVDNNNDDDSEQNQQPNVQSNGLAADDSVRSSFREYCANAQQNFAPLDEDHKAAIRLMDILKRKKAPMDTYDELMAWHLRDKKELLEGQTLGDCDAFISRDVLIKKLKARYHMTDKFPFVKELVLPYSRAKVQLVCTEARDCIQSLLTDPRLKDSDFDFFDNDPLAPPPENLTYVAGAQTGEAYRKAHAEYVTKEGEVGAGIMWYIDGAVTGQFENLEIVALKMSLTMFTREYRMKDHAWRTLGYVVNYSKANSRGKKMFADSRHIDSQAVAAELLEEEGEAAAKADVSEEKAQDFHAQLDTILSSYVQLEATGMTWDLYYRGKVHNVVLVFWTIMVRCDTDEAELLCGKYRMRAGNVKNLCRYCTCPREKTDDPKACYPFKTVPMMKKLIEEDDMAGLKAISQQKLDNCWYKLRFNPADSRGIHGACPAEMLHAMLLGIFKYARECFFAQIGKTSLLALEINGLAKQFGDLFAHQSERDMPKCKFAEGIRKNGKIMAKEYRGVLLIMATVLRSTAGKALLKKNKNFKDEAMIKDWLLLVELLLQWEAYLCEPKMELFHVRRMMRKNRFIMHIMKKVARRSAGMGLKLFKFHAIVHMALDIILYGVPMEHDTGSNESGHKITKVAAKLTQKKASVFEIQTATRLAEFFLVELALEELDGRPLWDYFEGFDHPPEHDSQPQQPDSQPTEDVAQPEVSDDEAEAPVVSTGGAKILVSQGDDGEPMWKIISKMKNKDRVLWNNDVKHCLYDLQAYVSEWMPELPLYTEHKRNGQIFRAHPNYRGEGVWRDWALVNWGEESGKLPCEIWGFVVLDGLPEVEKQDPLLHFGGITLKNGTYALVEASTWSTNETAIGFSDIFVPFTKDVGRLDKDGCVVSRKFYLADVEAIVAPLCVIPDFGSRPRCNYFQVRPRSAWVGDFISWLEDPHDGEALDDSEDDADISDEDGR